MKKGYLILLLFNLSVSVLFAGNSTDRLDKNIEITKLTDHAYLIQSSYACNMVLDCNHLLIVDSKDMVLVNTPAKDSLTAILLNCIAEKFKRNVTKVIVSHFHDDSSGGLLETGKRGIISYSLDKTRDLLTSEDRTINHVFTDSMTISLQNTSLQLFYFGAGHSVDNIVTWIPSEHILFGGCLLKSKDSKDKGNIKDADLRAWPVTVRKVENRFKDASIVIPGHLAIGDSSLFEHTLDIVKIE
ncbi:MAG TPA: subclass B1 metallo-beta-lactamase [Prolixibacteraceae bacterium]|jgi:metallo-beta-lactamase class B|nr:subclass B1 metallo-beta-lactamase [Prolixibacteraceae bacterium]